MNWSLLVILFFTSSLHPCCPIHATLWTPPTPLLLNLCSFLKISLQKFFPQILLANTETRSILLIYTFIVIWCFSFIASNTICNSIFTYIIICLLPFSVDHKLCEARDCPLTPLLHTLYLIQYLPNSGYSINTGWMNR